MDKMLTVERKCEIAYLAAMYHNRHNGVTLGPNTLREIGNKAKAIDVPYDEMLALAREMFLDVNNAVFSASARREYVLPSSYTQRKGEIAYKDLRQRFLDGGVKLNKEFRKTVGHVASETSIPFVELIEVLEEIIRSVVDEMFIGKNDQPTSSQ